MRRRVHQLAALCMAIAIAGCAAFQTPPPARTFRLAYEPPDAQPEPPLPVVVRVVPFGIAATYDRQGFIYRSGPYDLGVDHYNRWLGSPAAILSDLVARDLAAAHAVSAVLQSPSALPNDYELSGYIETLEERDGGGSCTAHLRVRILLVRAPAHATRYVVLEQGFVADEACTPGDPAAYAAAMSHAAERISAETRAAVLAAIRADQSALHGDGER
jgi:ABC-type uncharacterized transport system auxiliary subunit